MGQNVFIYWGEEKQHLLYTGESLSIEAGVQVTEPFESTGRVRCSTTPGGAVATVVHFGPYEKLSEAHGVLRDWCKTNGHSLAGPNWEIYGHWDENPERLRTDVCYLLKQPAVSAAE
ncbi:GyrI-like domain-containing protein [Fimbriiglobus ruber]|uniref:GyrI-like small molecule binding domain-containing protein n=1 Tax=Fimbriiglobus ruber TaxID=1908690 RepID=A0A225DAN4_9BACT|nr:GyrI-like domain-containing protein [Fimbriiglobus ruber]OWK38033.1 hypothetical protein FRUB_07153 [Fimbriiglobus ruber]